jgi:hypothetical protein
MFPDYLKEYRPTYTQYKESRKKDGIPNARAALHNAKYNLYRANLLREWQNAGGDIIPHYDASDDWETGQGRVRIIESPDYHCDMDDLKGDCFNPDVNTDINPNRLAREERGFEDRVNRDGVWGYRAEYWNGSKWIETDSIWGVIGGDFHESCDDDELMESALDSLLLCECKKALELESTRPDMYTESV